MLNLLIKIKGLANDPWRLTVLGTAVTCFGEMEIEVQDSDALDPHSRFSAAVPDNFFYGAYQMINAAQIMTTYGTMTDVPTCLSSTQRHR
jgi:hypothetical protein